MRPGWKTAWLVCVVTAGSPGCTVGDPASESDTGADPLSDAAAMAGDGDGGAVPMTGMDGGPTDPDAGAGPVMDDAGQSPGDSSSDGGEPSEPTDAGNTSGTDAGGDEPTPDAINSNLQVRIDGRWRGVCCRNGRPVVSTRECDWTHGGRVLTDETDDSKLDCPENGGRAVDCTCNDSGERMHGAPDGPVMSSLELDDGAPIFPNIGRETCVYVDDADDDRLKTRLTDGRWDDDTESWPDPECPHFRLIE